MMLFLFLFVSVVRSDDSGSCGNDCKWIFTEADGKLEISGTGEMSSYSSGKKAPWDTHSNIIETIEIKGMTSIGNYAFYGFSRITTIDIPETITKIGNRAFYACESLTSVTIPKSVTSIGTGPFASCDKLETIEVSSDNGYFVSVDGVLFTKSMETLIQYPDGNTTQEYVVPEGVKHIGEASIYVVPFLKHITFSDNVETIGYEACRHNSFETIILGENITKIGGYAFDWGLDVRQIIFKGTTEPDCSSNTFQFVDNAIIVPSEYNGTSFCGRPIAVSNEEDKAFVTGNCGDSCTFEFEAVSGKLTITGNGPMTEWSSGSKAPWYQFSRSIVSVEITGISSVGKNSFVTTYNYVHMTSLIFGEGVETIGAKAFDSCPSLLSITWSKTTEPTCGDKWMRQLMIPIIVPSQYVNETFCEKTILKLNENNKAILNGECGEQCVFEYDATSGKLTISGSGKMTNYSYGKAPWYPYCDSISEITIDGMESIGTYAFYQCDKFIEMNIPETVTMIGNNAFQGCSSLQSVNIPNTVTSIGSYAFQSCSSLKSIDIPDNVTALKIDVFKNCLALSTVTIGKGVLSIHDDAFRQSSKIRSIDVSEENPAYRSVDGALFTFSMDKLLKYPSADPRKEYTVPRRVKTIVRYAFNGASSLKSITLPDGVTEIKQNTFDSCSFLSTIRFGIGIKSIESVAFNYCSALKSIVIPESVTTIGGSAFNSCSRLKTVYFEGLAEPSTCNDNAFGDTSIIVPTGYEGTDFCGKTVTKEAMEVTCGEYTDQYNDNKKHYGCSCVMGSTFVKGSTTKCQCDEEYSTTTNNKCRKPTTCGNFTEQKNVENNADECTCVEGGEFVDKDLTQCECPLGVDERNDGKCIHYIVCGVLTKQYKNNTNFENCGCVDNAHIAAENANYCTCDPKYTPNSSNTKCSFTGDNNNDNTNNESNGDNNNNNDNNSNNGGNNNNDNNDDKENKAISLIHMIMIIFIVIII